MKKLFSILLILIISFTGFSQAITDTTALKTAINTDIVPASAITATKLNRILLGNTVAIPKYSWGIKGITGSNPSIHFIGTTDAQPIVFKTNGTEVGRISGDGNGKVSFGIGNTASGVNSFAAGDAAVASGTTSFAFGTHVTASGSRSVVIGNYSTASGTYGMALGNANIASGTSSTAIGANSTASGVSSFAAGDNATASGNYSSVLNGYGNIASGANAAAIGNNLKSKSFAGITVGLFNDSANASSSSAYSATNRAFQIGIGTADNSRANAVTVLYNGSVGVGTVSPDASSLLDISTTTKGVLFPRLNTTQQNAISSPASGLIIWNTDSLALSTYNGTAWVKVGAGGGGSGVTGAAAIGSTPNANGLTISGSTINLQPSNGTYGGVISTSAQTMGAGVKTFSDTIRSQGLSIGKIDTSANFNWFKSSAVYNGVTDYFSRLGYNLGKDAPEDLTKSFAGIQQENDFVNWVGGPKMNEFIFTVGSPNQRFVKRPIHIEYQQATPIIAPTSRTLVSIYADDFYIGNDGGDTTIGAGSAKSTFSVLPIVRQVNYSPYQTKNVVQFTPTAVIFDSASLTIKNYNSGEAAQINLQNNANRTFTIQHNGTTAGNNGTLVFSHSSGAFAVIDSLGRFGSGTQPSERFHAYATGSANAMMRMEATGSGNSGLTFYNNGSFKGQFSTSANELSYYNAVSNTTPIVVTGSNGNVSINSTYSLGTTYASAILSANSTTKGFLPPRQTTSERNAISSPAAGLQVYNTTTNDLNIYNNSIWRRVMKMQGVDVASTAGAMTLGTDGTSFEITGTNSITLISNVGWVNGDEVTLMFTGAATLINGTSTSGNNITIKLSGATDFVASADDVITLVLGEIGGVQAWREKCRSVN